MVPIEDIERISACDARYVRVLGGGGTGKTFAVVERVAHLLQSGVQPQDIQVIAATRSAAQALSHRLAQQGGTRAPAVCATTAAQCFEEMLASPAARACTGRVTRLLADFEERILMEDMKVCGLKPKRLREMLKFFFREWTELGDEREGFLLDEEERTVHTAIKGHLAARGAMLPAELSGVACRFLRDFPQEAAAWRRAYVIVDDFQNLNRASQQALDLMATTQLMVCGNVNEQVESAEPYPYARGFAAFAEEHAGCETFTLTRALRCPPRVNAMANSLAVRGGMDEGTLVALAPEAATPAPPQQLAGGAAQGAGAVRLVQWPLPNDEFMGVARFIKHQVAPVSGEPTLRPRDVLVVVPNALWGRAIGKVLAANGIACDQLVSYHALKGDPRDAKKSADIRAFSLLNLAAEPHDATAWRTWCGLGDFLTHSNHWCRLEEYAAARGVSVADALASLDELADDPFLGADVLRERYRAARAILQPVEGRRGFALTSAFKEPGASTLPQGFAALLEPMTGTESAEELMARARGRLENQFTDADAVRIALPHMACGLEFSCVVVAGMVEGFYPRPEAFDIEYDEDRQEAFAACDRRALYSAIVKTREQLVVSLFQKDEANTAAALGMRVGRIRNEHGTGMARVEPSRFIEELGGEAPGMETSLP